MRSWSFVVGLLTVVASAPPASASQVLLKNRAVTCVATTPNIVRMWVDGTGFMLTPGHSSAHALIHLQLRDNSSVAYAVSGQADRIGKDLAPNSGGRSIAYAGIECTIFHRNITSVHDCRGTADKRTCEVGLAFSGAQHAYLVSVSIKPVVGHQ
jgi:hypothetical protein